MPALQGVGNSGYTQISTNGTTTLNQGQASGVAANPGVLYGAQLIALGTAPVATFLDIWPNGTATTTTTLYVATGTAAGQQFSAGIPGVGVRYKGALVVVTTGTAAGTWNALWD